jgi:hypothetical protein
MCLIQTSGLQMSQASLSTCTYKLSFCSQPAARSSDRYIPPLCTVQGGGGGAAHLLSMCLVRFRTRAEAPLLVKKVANQQLHQSREAEQSPYGLRRCTIIANAGMETKSFNPVADATASQQGLTRHLQPLLNLLTALPWLILAQKDTRQPHLHKQCSTSTPKMVQADPPSSLMPAGRLVTHPA